jgi:hypothetical protein
MTTDALLAVAPAGQAGRSSRRPGALEYALMNRPESMSWRR